MYKNIGGKIKTVAIIFSILFALGFFYVGIYTLSAASEINSNNIFRSLFFVLGFIFLIGGPLMSWVSGFCLYGFGQLITDTQQTRDMIGAITNKYMNQNVVYNNNPGINTANNAPEWHCSCGASNSAASNFCRACGQKRP